MTLNELIKQVAEQTDAADPRELALFVAKSAPPKQLRDLFAEAIVDDCRQYLMGQRNHAFDGVRRTNRSARLERQGDWWAKFLAAKESFRDGSWKPFGDCTVDDLQLSVKQHEANIANQQTRVEFRKQVISLMLEYNVTHVRDLPRDAVQNGLAA